MGRKAGCTRRQSGLPVNGGKRSCRTQLKELRLGQAAEAGGMPKSTLLRRLTAEDPQALSSGAHLSTLQAPPGLAASEKRIPATLGRYSCWCFRLPLTRKVFSCPARATHLCTQHLHFRSRVQPCQPTCPKRVQGSGVLHPVLRCKSQSLL